MPTTYILRTRNILPPPPKTAGGTVQAPRSPQWHRDRPPPPGPAGETVQAPRTPTWYHGLPPPPNPAGGIIKASRIPAWHHNLPLPPEPAGGTAQAPTAPVWHASRYGIGSISRVFPFPDSVDLISEVMSAVSNVVWVRMGGREREDHDNEEQDEVNDTQQ